MTIGDYEKAGNFKLDVKKKTQARKSFCACYLSNDIGAYNSCLHLCSYCYANGNPTVVKRNYMKHDDNSPFLIGGYLPNDVIRDAKQESWVIKDGEENE